MFVKKEDNWEFGVRVCITHRDGAKSRGEEIPSTVTRTASGQLDLAARGPCLKYDKEGIACVSAGAQ